jgi:hypothetical protein
VAHAVHVIQQKLLSRPAYRRYKEVARGEKKKEAPTPGAVRAASQARRLWGRAAVPALPSWAGQGTTACKRPCPT